jgi:hypothetical protein
MEEIPRSSEPSRHLQGQSIKVISLIGVQTMNPTKLTENQAIMCRIAEDHFELMMSDYQKGTPADRLMDCNVYLQELQKDVILDRSDVEFFSTIHRLATYKFKLLVLDQ